MCWSCGCDISLELPLAAVSFPGWYEISGGVGEPDLPLADRGVNQSDSAEAAEWGMARDGESRGQVPADAENRRESDLEGMAGKDQEGLSYDNIHP